MKCRLFPSLLVAAMTVQKWKVYLKLLKPPDLDHSVLQWLVLQLTANIFANPVANTKAY